MEIRHTQASQDLSDVYQELTQLRAQKVEIESEKQRLAHELQGLQSLIKNRSLEADEKNKEIQQY